MGYWLTSPPSPPLWTTPLLREDSPCHFKLDVGRTQGIIQRTTTHIPIYVFFCQLFQPNESIYRQSLPHPCNPLNKAKSKLSWSPRRCHVWNIISLAAPSFAAQPHHPPWDTTQQCTRQPAPRPHRTRRATSNTQPPLWLANRKEGGNWSGEWWAYCRLALSSVPWKFMMIAKHQGHKMSSCVIILRFYFLKTLPQQFFILIFSYIMCYEFCTVIAVAIMIIGRHRDMARRTEMELLFVKNPNILLSNV